MYSPFPETRELPHSNRFSLSLMTQPAIRLLRSVCTDEVDPITDEVRIEAVGEIRCCSKYSGLGR